MTIIIRDDDTSFFTPPAQLEQIYGRLWDQGMPVCIAVIPAHNANVRVNHRPNRPLDSSIPPAYRGKTQEYSVLENPELCAYLNEKARQGLVEICQHGYAHTYMEFLSEDARSLRHKLAEGRRLLQAAFPDALLKTFIAPYDRISPVGLEAVLDFGYDICTATENLISSTAMPQLEPYRSARLPNDRKLFTSDEYLFTHREDPAVCLENAHQRLQTEGLLIICNHYWIFYYDWQETVSALGGTWQLFIDSLLSHPDRQITTFAAFDNLRR